VSIRAGVPAATLTLFAASVPAGARFAGLNAVAVVAVMRTWYPSV